MDETVLLERDGHVAIITINRPAVHNCVDAVTSVQVDRALTSAENDPDVMAVVLTGMGQLAFCTGMDLKYAATHGVEGVMIPGRGFCGLTSRQEFTKPLIAAVNGNTMAGGFELALACDMIVAGSNARFALPEVKRGLFAGAGGIIRLTRRIPGNVALEIVMTGTPVDAHRAHQLGIVNQVVEPDRTVEAAVELANAIAENAPISVRISKQLSYAALDLDFDAARSLGAELGRQMMGSEDRKEGVLAFAEGRKPRWTGK